MINLIPKEEKKRMIAIFYRKIIILFFMMLSLCVLFAFVFLIPSYFFSTVNGAAINAKIEVQKNEPLPLYDQQTLVIVKDINSKLDLVENSQKNSFSISERAINTILLKKRADIKITQILYENNSVFGKKISIIGTAPSREVLLLFRRAMEDDPTFKNVDLPISNFVKGSNIQFHLSLTPI